MFSRCRLSSARALTPDTLDARRNRQKQACRPTGEGVKAVVPVEGNRRIIDRIDHQGERRRIQTSRALESVGKQDRSEARSAITQVNCQSTYERRGHGLIARKPLGLILRKLGQGHACRGQCIVTGDPVRVHRRCNKAVADVPSNVLTRLAAQISIERLHAAGKGSTIMIAR